MLSGEKEHNELIELQKKLAVPIFSVDEIYERLEPEALRCLKPEVMLNYSCIPIGIGDPGAVFDALYIVVSAELTDQQKDELALISNKRILVSAVAQKKDIAEAINSLVSRGVFEAAQIGANLEDLHEEQDLSAEETRGINDYDVMEGFSEDDDVEFGQEETDAVELERSVEDSPVVRLVNLILIDGIRRNASHIHVEPYEKDFRVRLRIDGMLYEVMRPPMSLKNAIIARIKINSDMDIANRLTPQIGKIVLRLSRCVERTLLVSTLPTPHGEKIVLKILDGEGRMLRLPDLGLEEEQMKIFEKALQKPGLILVGGQANSGKRSLLQATAESVCKTTSSVAAIGDDFSRFSPGIDHHLTMNTNFKLNRAEALRQVAGNQDADAIVLDNLNDPACALEAVRAAGQGKRVLAGFDCFGDSADVIVQMQKMKIDPYLLSSALNSCVSSRLVRKLCPDCKKPADKIGAAVVLQALGQDVKKAIAESDRLFLPGDGCRTCLNTSFHGRTGIFEILRITEEMREFVANGANTEEIRSQMRQENMMSLFDAGVKKVFAGLVSHKEILALDLVK